MAYRELSMMDVKEVLRRWSAGHSDRRIGREAGVDRKTVARYTTAATRLGFAKGRDITEDDVHAVAQVVQARPAPTASDEWSEVARHRDRIEQWLRGDAEKRPLRLSKVHTLLVRDHDLQASYDTLRRFAMTELAWRKKAVTVRVEDPPPGQEAQVDFGKMGRCSTRRPAARARSLGAHRHALVQPLPVRVADVRADDRGRVRGPRPRLAVLRRDGAQHHAGQHQGDRSRRPDALTPRLVARSSTTRRLAACSSTRPAFARPRTRPASRIKSRTFARAGSTARRSRTRRRARERRALVARRRRRARARHHAAGPSASLREHRASRDASSADVAGSTCPTWIDKLEGPPDHHVQVAHALYSVPTRTCDKDVSARADTETVRIYFGTELIKVHPRKPPGGRSTDVRRLP
jgi:hypothetical protein